MSWEMGSEYKEFITPSLVEYVYLKAEQMEREDGVCVLTREIAFQLILDQNCHKDDYDEESLREEYKNWDLYPLLEVVKSNIDTMTNGAFNFEIGKGGWTRVPVCSFKDMIRFYDPDQASRF